MAPGRAAKKSYRFERHPIMFTYTELSPRTMPDGLDG